MIRIQYTDTDGWKVTADIPPDVLGAAAIAFLLALSIVYLIATT